MNRYEIADRILDRLSDNYDKTEQSPFHDIAMSLAIELEDKDIDCDLILDKAFADTAMDNDLDRVIFRSGVVRKKATKSTGLLTIEGVPDTTINIGSIFTSDITAFRSLENKIIPSTGQIDILIECLEEGVVGNVPQNAINKGEMLLNGVTRVFNQQAFTNGYKEESDEEVRERYYTKVQTPSTSGNDNDYINWSKEVVGVGASKVFSCWDGNNTVKVLIIDSNKKGASTELIKNTFDYIETKRPIGAEVTVVSAKEIKLNIKSTVVYDKVNYTLDNILNAYKQVLDNYIQSIAFNTTYISFAKLSSLLLDIEGVYDYNTFLLNDAATNISVGNEYVAVVGEVELSE